MVAAPYRILVVCTANICRSVMGELILRRDLGHRGLDGVEVGSCGLMYDDQPASDKVIAVMAERGIDAGEHRSRVLTPEVLEGIDLVVAMERRHAREVALAAGGSSPIVHTLGALATGLAAVDDPAATPAERVARFAADRRSSDLLGSGADEVADPHGKSKRRHRKTADRIEALCAELLDGLFGTPAP